MITTILLAGFVLRILSLNQSLWLDEAIGALVVRDNSFLGILNFVGGDNHPPLYYLGLKVWSSLFGYTEVSLRMLSVFLGVLSILLLYFIAKKLAKGQRFSALLAALFLATSPLHIYYSQEARMYVLAGFFALVAIYSFLATLENKGYASWIAFSFSISALVFTDYIPVFFLPVFWILGYLARMGKRWWLTFLLAHIPLVVLGMLWLPTLAIQVKGGSWLLSTLPSWREIAGGATVKELGLVWTKFVLGRISLANKLFYYSLVGLASLPLIFSGFMFLRVEKKYRIVWLWLSVPLLLSFGISFFFPAFTYFRFIFLLPAFYLLVSLGIAEIKIAKLKSLIAASIVIINLFGWGIYTLDANQQREKWREAVAFIQTNAKKDEIVIFDYPEPFAPYRWYADGTVEVVGAADSISVDQEKTSAKTKKLVENKKGVYSFDYLVDLTDPARVVEQTLGDEGFKVSQVYGDFIGVGQIKYWVR
jgi:uncharacterized membrane protein